MRALMIIMMMLVTMVFTSCGNENNIEKSDDYSITYGYTREHQNGIIIQPTDDINESDKIIIDFNNFDSNYIIGVYNACVLLDNNDIFDFDSNDIICDNEIELKNNKIVIVDFDSNNSVVYIKLNDESNTIN